MRKMMQKLHGDTAGIATLEYLLVAAMLSLSLIVGLSSLGLTLDNDLTELANAIAALDQGNRFATVNGSKNGTSTSEAQDTSTAGSNTTHALP